MARRKPLSFAQQVNAVLRQSVYYSYTRCSPSETWSPAVNVYQLAKRLEVCVDLAGIDPERTDVRVEPDRLLIEGERRPPEPRDAGQGPMRILNMEIDYGRFRREIALPSPVNTAAVRSRYDSGMLCITLPLQERGSDPKLNR